MLRDGDPIRVLMISPQFRPLLGGYERAAERLSEALANEGLRVVVIAERRDRAWPAMEYSDGYKVWRLSCLYRPRLHIITSLLSFAGFLMRHGCNFDVWHVHQYGYHAALAVALGKVLRRPVVLSLTSSGDMGIEKALDRQIAKRLLRYFHLRVSSCLAVSKETHEEAIRFGTPPDRIHRIPTGVDGSQFHPASPEERADARRTLGLNCERLVLYVGRLSPEKNSLGLLDAWAIIDTKARENAVLALVGDGPEWDKVQAKAKEPRLAGSVHLAGRRSDVATWYRAADMYVLPSILEGLANTMIEALASGLPVISTRVSGSSILSGSLKAGIVVDVGNTKQLTVAMESLLQDASVRSQLGHNARLTFESQFSLDDITRKMVLLYESLLDRNQKQEKI